MKKKLTKTGLIFTLAIIYVNLINAQDYLITLQVPVKAIMLKLLRSKTLHSKIMLH